MDKHRPASIAATVTAASFGFALVQLDVTIVNVALPAMAEALHSDIASLQWVVDAYALCFAALLLAAGHLGDRIGARAVYMSGLLVFGLASLVCGLAPSPAVLIVGRTLQGVGAAAMLPCSLTLVNHAAARDAGLRAKAVGWWTAAGSIAIAAGPVIGGLILGVASWRLIFLVNLPGCALGALLTLRVAETDRQPHAHGFDLRGQIAGVLALAGLVGAVIESKPRGPLSPVVVGSALMGIAATWAFIRTEARSRNPMMPLGLFRNAAFSTAIVYGLAANLTFYGMVFVLSFYLQRVLGYDAVQTGIAYLPLTATLFVSNLLSGWLVGRIGSRVPMIVGALIDASGFALLLLLDAHSSYARMLPAFTLMSFGLGLGVPAMTTALLASVERSRSGLASGVLNAARQAGGAVGVAIFGALAGDGRGHVVVGLHHSAVSSIVLLGAAAALSAVVLKGRRQA